MHHLRNRKGQGFVEYALILAVIAVIALVGLKAIGTKVNTQFDTVAAKVENPTA